jgi:hypothetical protein
MAAIPFAIHIKAAGVMQRRPQMAIPHVKTGPQTPDRFYAHKF